jgi:HEPN domain-containing protein
LSDPSPEQREYAQLLLERAKSDLAALRVLMANEDMLDDVVGFHAQQAAEKALKVALVMADIDFPRSHDLRELADMALDHGIAVPESVQEARWLTPWAAQLRYEMLEPLDRDAALSVAADTVEWARALIAEPEDARSS